MAAEAIAEEEERKIRMDAEATVEEEETNPIGRRSKSRGGGKQIRTAAKAKAERATTSTTVERGGAAAGAQAERLTLRVARSKTGYFGV